MQRPRHAFGLLGVLAFAGACGQILGLEDAYVDENLTQSETTAGGGQTAESRASSGGTTSAGGGASTADSTSSATSSSSGDDSTSATSAGGAAADSTTTGDPEPASLCSSYCDAIGEYCVDENLQYRDSAQCLKVCRAFEAGEVDAQDANTAACRLKYAGKARYAAGTELAAYCRQAGPGGDDRCGSNCEGLCTIMMAACTESEAAPYFYEDMETCLAQCEPLPQVDYFYGIADGNSVQCRLFHAASALMADAGEHCQHALGVILCEEQDE